MMRFERCGQGESNLAEPAVVQPVKWFVAALWKEASSLDDALRLLCEQWGSLDHISSDIPFDVTHFYDDEMGTGLLRRLVSFQRLMPPDELAPGKLLTNEMEIRLAHAGRRRVNLDLGYLDHNKIVLASLKAAGQKIYLGQGVYADLIARWRDGAYHPFEWTFPDFRDGRYNDFLCQIRTAYLRQLRATQAG
jgi:hypothetical protein